MFAAVLIAVGAMMLAAGPLSRLMGDNPTVVTLALGFLLMIGTTLLANGMGVHIPKGYIYAAMAFASLIEGLNMMARRRRQRRGHGRARVRVRGSQAPLICSSPHFSRERGSFFGARARA
jgi:predicted tellurium resistance membrane protein TerC